MSARDPQLPARMRDYQVQAEFRDAPDLHRLAQVFIGMALARTHQTHPGPGRSGSESGGRQRRELESEM